MMAKPENIDIEVRLRITRLVDGVVEYGRPWYWPRRWYRRKVARAVGQALITKEDAGA